MMCGIGLRWSTSIRRSQGESRGGSLSDMRIEEMVRRGVVWVGG